MRKPDVVHGLWCLRIYVLGQVIKAAEDASAAERSFLLLEKRADADREENRCLGAQKDLRISELEAQVRKKSSAHKQAVYSLLCWSRWYLFSPEWAKCFSFGGCFLRASRKHIGDNFSQQYSV